MNKTAAGICLCAGLTIGTLGFVTSSDVDVIAKTKKVAVKHVKVKEPYAKKAVIAKGKKVRLDVEVTTNPKKKSYQKVKYTSKDKKIATVNKKGVVKAKKVGSTKIIVTSVKNKKKRVTIAVKVVKYPVKKVSLDAKNVSIFPGKTMTLKATVSVPAKKKGSTSKELYWTSSNRGVASVTQKGVVKAKKTGTTKVTVKATDGSGKKATCTVQVVAQNTPNNPIPIPTPENGEQKADLTITSFGFYNDATFGFSLDKEQVLTANDVVLETRKSSGGKYQYRIPISSLSTLDNKNYVAVMLDGDYELQHSYFRLSLVGYPKAVWEYARFGTVGNYQSSNVMIKTAGNPITGDRMGFSNAVGFCNIQVSEMPEGITYEEYQRGIILKGIFNEPGVYSIEMSMVDEQGSQFQYKKVYLVESETSLQAAVEDAYVDITNTSENTISKSVYVTGGSGKYTYSMGDNPYGLIISETGTIRGNLNQTGVIQVPVYVQDAENPELKTETIFTCYGQETKNITGKILDAEGKPMVGYIYATGMAKGGYLRQWERYVGEEDNGCYNLSLPVGEYDIYARPEGAKSEYCSKLQHYKVEKDAQMEDITIPVYCVYIENGLAKGGWYDSVTKEYSGFNKYIYVTPGNYVFHTYYNDNTFLNPEVYQVVCSVTNAGVQVKAESTTLPPNIVQGAQGNNRVALKGNFYTAIAFTPTESGTYTFESTGYIDSYAVLFDASANEMERDDDSGSNRNFMIVSELEAGATYYINVRNYNTEKWAEFMDVMIKKN